LAKQEQHQEQQQQQQSQSRRIPSQGHSSNLATHGSQPSSRPSSYLAAIRPALSRGKSPSLMNGDDADAAAPGVDVPLPHPAAPPRPASPFPQFAPETFGNVSTSELVFGDNDVNEHTANGAPRKVILFQTAFLEYLLQIKFAQALVSTVLSDHVLLLLIGSAVCQVLLLVITIRMQPSNVVEINVLRSGLMTMSLWSCFCGIIAVITDDENNVASLALLIGWAILLLALILWLLRTSRGGGLSTAKKQQLLKQFLLQPSSKMPYALSSKTTIKHAKQTTKKFDSI
jgi:hypothetical protein